jgi:hypothetical protein
MFFGAVSFDARQSDRLLGLWVCAVCPPPHPAASGDRPTAVSTPTTWGLMTPLRPARSGRSPERRDHVGAVAVERRLLRVVHQVDVELVDAERLELA